MIGVECFRKKKASPDVLQARLIQYRSQIFGSPAIMITFVTLDPFALRRRFSPGLPFRLFSSGHSVNYIYRFDLNTFVISGY
jgi:hypothetical protein